MKKPNMKSILVTKDVNLRMNPDQTEVMVFADDAAKMNRVLDRMNLDFVKAESGSMVRATATGSCAWWTPGRMRRWARP